MKWKNQNVSDLTLEELQDALIEIAEMDNFRTSKLASNPKKASKINPKENLAFTQLLNEINEQIEVKQNVS